jgi:GntR family transcriptional regulator, rspAB operon transcriptional repressor
MRLIMDVDKTTTPQIIDLTNINEKAYHLIKGYIVDFTYPPGHNLNINELKNMLGVSPTPIKDALFKLSGEGLVVINPRKGTYVKDVTDEDIHEIIQARIFLEMAVIDALAGKITDEQLQILDGLYQIGISIKVDEGNMNDYKAYMESDCQFHLSFFHFMGNKRLTEIYKSLNAHMQIVRYRLMHHGRGKNPWTDQDHKDILTALKQRDFPGAGEAVRKHLLRLEAACLDAGSGERLIQ